MKLFTVTSGERSEVVKADELVQEGDVLHAKIYNNSTDGSQGLTLVGQWRNWTEWKKIEI